MTGAVNTAKGGEGGKIVETSGEYRTAVGVLINAKDENGKLLRCWKLQGVGQVPPEADTRGMYKQCRVAYNPVTREAYSLSVGGKMLASISPEFAVPVGRGGGGAPEGEAQAPQEAGSLPEHKLKRNIRSTDGVCMQMTGDNEIVRKGKVKAVSAQETTTRTHTSETFGTTASLPETEPEPAASLPLQAINGMTLPDAAKTYLKNGFKLVACEPRSKAAYTKGWSNPDFSEKAEHWKENPTDNIGCPAGRSGLIFVDIDDEAKFEILCGKLDPELMRAAKVDRPYRQAETARISSGRENSGKLVFRVPDGVKEQLSLRKVAWAKPDIDEKGEQKTDENGKPKTIQTSVVEFRCGEGCHDVLPPSIHPSGSQYAWAGNEIKDAPDDLTHLITNWKLYEDIINRANPDYEKVKEIAKFKAPVKTQARTATAAVSQKSGGFCPIGLTQAQFAELNRYHDPEEFLSPAEYEQKTGKRWLYRGSKSGSAGVVKLPNGKLWSFHSGDPLSEHPHDTWDMLLKECSGDHAQAVKTALQLIGRPTSLADVSAADDPEPVPQEQHVQTGAAYVQPPAPNTKTLDQITEEISQMNGIWLKTTVKKAKNGDAEDVVEASLDLPAWWRVWQEKTHLADDGDSKTGLYCFDGGCWQHIPFKKSFTPYLAGALKGYEGIKLPSGWNDIDKIISQRKGMMSFRAGSEADHIYCTDGTRITINADGGIQIDKGDPDRHVWLSTIGVSGADLFGDLNTVEWGVLLDRFPNFKKMMEKCDSDADKKTGRSHAEMMATIAGSALYSFFAPVSHFPALDAIFWLYDANVACTGKSAHLGYLLRAFGTLATECSPTDLLGGQGKLGNVVGCVLICVDEAADCKFADTVVTKAYVSGKGTARPMYCDPIPIKKPKIIVAAANDTPDLAAYKASPAIKRRVIPYEYTIQHEAQTETGCPEHEALAAVANLGLWMCRRIMAAVSGGLSGRSAWLYQTTEDEIERLFERVYWVPTLSGMLVKTQLDTCLPISTLWRSLIWCLVKEGRCKKIPLENIKRGDVKGYNLPAQLRSENAFRNAIQNRRLNIVTGDDGYGHIRTEEWICAVCDRGSKVPTAERRVLRGVALQDLIERIEPTDAQTTI